MVPAAPELRNVPVELLDDPRRVRGAATGLRGWKLRGAALDEGVDVGPERPRRALVEAVLPAEVVTRKDGRAVVPLRPSALVGVTHRDEPPGEVLRTEGGRLRCGIARMVRWASDAAAAESGRIEEPDGRAEAKELPPGHRALGAFNHWF